MSSKQRTPRVRASAKRESEALVSLPRSRFARAAAQGPFPTIMVFDKKLMRPACVLIQAVMGGFINGFDLELLQAEGADWLLAPTDAMQPYTVHSAAEFEEIRKMARAFHATRLREERGAGLR